VIYFKKHQYRQLFLGKNMTLMKNATFVIELLQTSCARGDTICPRPLQVDNIFTTIYSPGGTCSGMLAI